MTLIGCALVYTAVALLGVDNATLPSYVPFSAMCTVSKHNSGHFNDPHQSSNKKYLVFVVDWSSNVARRRRGMHGVFVNFKIDTHRYAR